MAMDIVSLLIQLVSGAVGGNLAGTMFKDINLGTLGNSIAGAVGGGLGGQILGALLGIGKAAAASNLDIGAIIAQIASGGVGGGVLMVIVGLIKQMMAK
jgi:hypothetical protein